MSLLYVLSNICVPYSLLLYETLKRGQTGAIPNYGKWLVLFVVTFLFNGLTIFNSWFITFIDLIIKIGIYFLPDYMNDIIEDRIRDLHLEGIIESYRCKFINKWFQLFSKSTHFMLKQLREEQRLQFQQALVTSLLSKDKEVNLKIQPKEKPMRNTEIQCIIINDKSIEEAKALFDKKLELIEKEKQQLQKNKLSWERKSSTSKKKYEAERQYEPKPQKQSINKVEIAREMTQTLPAGGFKQKNQKVQKQLGSSSSIKNLVQSSNFSAEDFQVEEEKPVSKLRYSRTHNEEKAVQKPVKTKKLQKEEQSVLRRSNTTLQGLKINSSNVASRQRSYSPDGSSLRQQAQILEKLDLSVSEYSDMFDEDEEQGEESKKLVCKVEAIVEIGAAPNARLEIYNLQLYSNQDLRIVSLYNREFERHKLISMIKGTNNYYELNLTGNVVNKRRVKFRGQFQPFTKYLQ